MKFASQNLASLSAGRSGKLVAGDGLFTAPTLPEDRTELNWGRARSTRKIYEFDRR